MPTITEAESRNKSAVLSPTEEALLDPSAAQAVYGKAISAVQEVFASPEELSAETFSALCDSIAEIDQLLCAGDQNILALTNKSTASNYLYAHSVNVSILAMRLGRELSASYESLRILGLAGMLHDIGMSPWLDLAEAGRELSSEEHADLQHHITEGARLTGQIHLIEDELRKDLVQVILEERRFKDASPQTSPGNSHLFSLAQIIGVCDRYEAMSHPRSWRTGLIPHESFKGVARLRGSRVDRKIIRAALTFLTVYPVGSFVELSTKETAVVVRTRPDHQTQPLVAVLADSNGARVEPYLVDLTKNQFPYVNQAVDETTLPLQDSKQLALFRAKRWWL